MAEVVSCEASGLAASLLFVRHCCHASIRRDRAALNSSPSCLGARTASPQLYEATMSISKNMARVRVAAIHGSHDAGLDSLENREAAVKADLTRRMKCVCADFSNGDFETLVKDMTREQLRGERVCGSRLRPC